MVAQYMWVDAIVNFDLENLFLICSRSQSQNGYFNTYNYLSPLSIILFIYFIVLCLFYFKIHVN